MRIVPITLKQANTFVTDYHRHNKATVGCKFAIGLLGDSNEGLVGVAICGRPVSRYLDDGFTLEINRVCTNGAKNACSMLYGACCRIAKNMGYKTVVTYTLQSEPGSSLKASNFKFDGEAGGIQWTGKRNSGKVGLPNERKYRWKKELK